MTNTCVQAAIFLLDCMSYRHSTFVQRANNLILGRIGASTCLRCRDEAKDFDELDIGS